MAEQRNMHMSATGIHELCLHPQEKNKQYVLHQTISTCDILHLKKLSTYPHDQIVCLGLGRMAND